jgi:hypothetical protein
VLNHLQPRLWPKKSKKFLPVNNLSAGLLPALPGRSGKIDKQTGNY